MISNLLINSFDELKTNLSANIRKCNSIKNNKNICLKKIFRNAVNFENYRQFMIKLNPIQIFKKLKQKNKTKLSKAFATVKPDSAVILQTIAKPSI